jgi:hypothetical protein
MAVRLSALRTGRRLPPGRFLILLSVTGWLAPNAIVRLEGLRQLKIQWPHRESNPRPSGLWIVPQLTTLPRVHLVITLLDFIIQLFYLFFLHNYMDACFRNQIYVRESCKFMTASFSLGLQLVSENSFVQIPKRLTFHYGKHFHLLSTI